jgi:alpha-tubulin suppressor-like RCC1 family protein
MPIRIDSLINRRILVISCGDNHTIALVAGMHNCEQLITDQDGEPCLVDVIGWGENSLGQVTGKIEVSRYNQPVVLSEFVGKRIINVGCYKATSSVVELGGNIYEWGGIDAKPVTLIHNIEQAQEIHHGNNFTIVKTLDKVFFWGEIRNKTGHILSERDPILISGDIKIKTVSVGYDHVLAQDNNGYVEKALTSFSLLAQMNLVSLLWRVGWTVLEN